MYMQVRAKAKASLSVPYDKYPTLVIGYTMKKHILTIASASNQGSKLSHHLHSFK